MGTYTEFIEYKRYEISTDDENYIEELQKVAEMFRNFDEALDVFLVEHGYGGELSNIETKVSFISLKFEQQKIRIPRNIRKWFTQHTRIERKTAFQICFAFNLGVIDTEDFFRRICLQRGFDCHNTDEVVYFYALNHKLCYQDARQVIDQVPKIKTGKVDFVKEVMYTASIEEELEKFNDVSELLSFITDHITEFGYNNVTAYEYIHKIWDEISSENGLALNEKNKLYASFDGIEEENNAQIKSKRTREDSIWGIYLQILGLSGKGISSIDKDRSLKPILKNNKLLHPLAEESFPDRNGMNKILNGEHVSYESVRKILILLVFYKFWVRLALERKSYEAIYGDTDRCTFMINNCLMDAGYPELYVGNPFDWIVLYALIDDYPLITFREYMRQMFYLKEAEQSIGSIYAPECDTALTNPE